MRNLKQATEEQETFPIVNFLLSLELLNIVNIFMSKYYIASYDHDIKVMH